MTAGAVSGGSSTIATPHQVVLVVDFGAQYAQLIARRVRELQVYSEIVGHDVSAADMRERQPSAIILSGGPASVHVEDAPRLDPGIFDLGIPILGICYGAQLIAHQLGGVVGRNEQGEYGRATLTVDPAKPGSLLGPEAPADQTVWMSHFDGITLAPDGFIGCGSTPNAPIAVFESDERRIWGVQYHPEVAHTPAGMDLLGRFLYDLAG